jgi:hypothetical protein
MVPIAAGQFVTEYRGEVRCVRSLLNRLFGPNERGPSMNGSMRPRDADLLPPSSLQIISRDESYRRVLTTYKEAKSYYFLDYDGHEVIDAVRQLAWLRAWLSTHARSSTGPARQRFSLHQSLVLGSP